MHSVALFLLRFLFSGTFAANFKIQKSKRCKMTLTKWLRLLQKQNVSFFRVGESEFGKLCLKHDIVGLSKHYTVHRVGSSAVELFVRWPVWRFCADLCDVDHKPSALRVTSMSIIGSNIDCVISCAMRRQIAARLLGFNSMVMCKWGRYLPAQQWCRFPFNPWLPLDTGWNWPKLSRSHTVCCYCRL